jgi:hypothetical protein
MPQGQRQLSQLQDPAFTQFRWGGAAEGSQQRR